MPASPPQFSGRSTFEVVEYAHERHLATLMIIFHDPHCVQYSAPGHPERPERIIRTIPVLKDRHRNWEWREPHPAKERNLLRAHSRDHVEQIRTAVHDFDVDTPVYPRIYDHAILSAGAALETALAGPRGLRPFSRMAPPAHHATRELSLGV